MKADQPQVARRRSNAQTGGPNRHVNFGHSDQIGFTRKFTCGCLRPASNRFYTRGCWITRVMNKLTVTHADVETRV